MANYPYYVPEYGSYLMSPDVFGMYYNASSKRKHLHYKKKMLLKQLKGKISKKQRV